MLLERTTVLRGPNYWSAEHHHLIVLNVDLEEYENISSRQVLGFVERLKNLFPSLNKNSCLNSSAAHFQEEAAGEGWCDILLQVSVELQRQIGICCNYGLHAPADREGLYHIIFAYGEEKSGRFAGEEAVRLVDALIKREVYNLRDTLMTLKAIWQANTLGPSTGSIYNEALRRGIPALKLDEGSFIQLGYGAAQKRFEATITSTTSNIAVDIAGNKHATKKLLTAACIPVPRGEVTRHVENLPELVEEIGFPVVIKPLDGNQGKGATINISSLPEAEKAFALAKTYSERIVIERFVEGFDFRVLVVNNRFIAAAKRTPAAVTGDGFQSIEQLVAKVNMDPRRGEGHSNLLTRIKIDQATIDLLAKRSYTLQTVPKKGEEVWLKATANLSTGGTAEDITDSVHPANRRLFERVARTVGLDICGIDIMAPDLTNPVNENGGAIIEVNAAPGFRMHLEPTSGAPRNVAAPVVDMLFPYGDTGRIPIIAVSGTNGKTTTTRLLAQMAQQGGYSTGFTTTDGIYLNNELIYKGDCSGPGSAQVVLKDASVEFAVLECARGGILRSGLGFDQCDCAVITNVAEDHLGLNGIDTIEKLARVKAVVAKSVKRDGYAVLNADDDLVYAMKDSLNCRIALFSLYPDNIRITRHCEAGGLAATFDEGYIMIRSGDQLIPVEAVENIPLTHGGRARFNVANALGAALAAYVSQIPLPAIRCTLRRFRNSIQDTPGRLNEFPFPNYTVLLDYAHNRHGVRALGEFISTIPASKKIGVITAVGDRRNEDIIAVGEEAGRIFDEIIIRYDDDLRGRTEFEISALLRTGIQKAAPQKKIHYCSNELASVDLAIRMATPDAYIVILVDNIKSVSNRLEELQSRKQDSLQGVRMTG